jgi:hypothetical protein
LPILGRTAGDAPALQFFGVRWCRNSLASRDRRSYI